MALSGIGLLDDSHRLGAFDCGKPALDAWLNGFALPIRPAASHVLWSFTTMEAWSATMDSRRV
ncbi:hypothetical protein [Mesorhizobium carmichaelinearum]|uniref:hypothetical protein n=1 Tax=Mesorhizobium carmichaelinearum TaxID=1208188 RepID=UPI000BA3EEB1|nr:hypothetical protein [Mesorhizobium carmichaelinearum]